MIFSRFNFCYLKHYLFESHLFKIIYCFINAFVTSRSTIINQFDQHYCINVCLVHSLVLSLLFIVSPHLAAVVRTEKQCYLVSKQLFGLASACYNHLSKPVLHLQTTRKVSILLIHLQCLIMITEHIALPKTTNFKSRLSLNLFLDSNKTVSGSFFNI
jgi:hypothetical protein